MGITLILVERFNDLVYVKGLEYCLAYNKWLTINSYFIIIVGYFLFICATF